MAYDNSINVGAPPLLWSNVFEAIQQINENFTIIGSSLGRSVAYDIAHIELENPVRIVLTSDQSGIVSGQQVFLSNTGISQLDGNTYYGKRTSNDEVTLYSDATLETTVDGVGYDSYASGGGTIQGLTDFTAIDFENFESDFIPSATTEFQLGSQTRRWSELHLGEATPEIEASEFNGLYLGSAHVKGINGVVDLPVNSTVNGQLIIDPNNTFFKEVQVDNDQVIVANSFVDSLNLISGTAIQMSVDSSAESVTITNTGVTELTAGAGISVDSATGDITISNTGVVSVTNGTSIPDSRTAGSGIVVDSSTGNILLTNTGILSVTGGIGVTANTTDGEVQVQINFADVPRTAFTQFVIDGDDSANTIEADAVNDVFTFNPGYGINLSNNATTDTLSISVDPYIDINGSVFAADSTLLVNALDGVIPAENLSGTAVISVVGDITGSVFADDSSVMVDAVDNKLNAKEIDIIGYGNAFQIYNGGFNWVTTGNLNLNVGGLGGITSTGNFTINSTSGEVFLTSTGSIGFSDGTTQTTAWTGVGDLTGSVFADNSTLLIDGVDGKIFAQYLEGTATIDVIGSVFGDDSTLLVNGVDGTLAYYPTTAGDWNGAAPTTVGEAIDRLATLVKALNAGTGA